MRILPTHGAGSFCSAGPGSARRVTSIGAERFANPTFALAGAEPAPELGLPARVGAQRPQVRRVGVLLVGALVAPALLAGPVAAAPAVVAG